MWVKRTPEEIVEVRLNKHHRRIRSAVAVGAVSLVLGTFTHGRNWRLRFVSWLAPFSEVPGRLLFSVPFSILLGLSVYWFGKTRPLMVCPKCETTKYGDLSEKCACGCRLEELETMKWK